MTLRSLLLLATLVSLASPDWARAETELTIMTFNVWGGGANESKPVDDTVAVIKAVNADIIGIQETRLENDPCTAEYCPPAGESVAAKIAADLGYHYYDQTAKNDALWANAILSRYPIVTKSMPNDTGVVIDVKGHKVAAFNIHLDDSPYQPYQLLNIEYGPFPFVKSADEAIKFAKDTRGPALKLLFGDMSSAGDVEASLVFGDFNEPSHHDWTEAAVKAGNQPMVVAYPTSKEIEDKGFVDTFREVYRDAGAKPGFTWTPTSDPKSKDDHHDRIDYVLAKAANLKVMAAGIVGEKAPEADVVVTPWPSDHRASYAKIKF